LHHHLKGDGNKIWKEENRCKFIVKTHSGSDRCNLLFKTKNKLKEHQKKSKHQNVRAKKTAAKPKKKQLRIDQVLRAARDATEAANENENGSGSDESIDNVGGDNHNDTDSEDSTDNVGGDMNEDQDEDDADEDEDNVECPVCDSVSYESDTEEPSEPTDVEWICCDRCDLWYHTPCAIKNWPTNQPKPGRKWYCC